MGSVLNHYTFIWLCKDGYDPPESLASLPRQKCVITGNDITTAV